MRLKYVMSTCPFCGQEHKVEVVNVIELALFKCRPVIYDVDYMYCDIAEQRYMDRQQIRKNDKKLKDAYRRNYGLLASDEICDIRVRYEITQSDLCILLGWGTKTIARYESHQVQDRAHDTILKKIDSDPEWFLSLLEDAKDKLSEEAYRKYLGVATALYESEQDRYLKKAIQASYVKFRGNPDYSGNAELSFDKVVDVIRYFAASTEVTDLYKGKLMNLMWYADALAYRRGRLAITGLIYLAFRMGPKPIGHNLIIHLKDVPCEQTDMEDTSVYHFSLKKTTFFPFLTEDDKAILDEVIEKLGKLSKCEIIYSYLQEYAYKETLLENVILFKYAFSLKI